MPETFHDVDLRYTRVELEALFALANRQDVEQGGRYDARGAAINIWSHGWSHRAMWEESSIMGTFYVEWDATPKIDFRCSCRRQCWQGNKCSEQRRKASCIMCEGLLIRDT